MAAKIANVEVGVFVKAFCIQKGATIKKPSFY